MLTSTGPRSVRRIRMASLQKQSITVDLAFAGQSFSFSDSVEGKP